LPTRTLKLSGQIANLLVRLVPQRDVKHEGVLGVETEHLLDADLVVVEVGDLRDVPNVRPSA
jgi:hypothetical protein